MPKSYREANTEMRAHFDEMQGEVEHKVEEAMVSFREQRLRTKSAPASTRVDTPAPVTEIVRPRRALWPFGLVMVASLALLGWLHGRPDEQELLVAPPVITPAPTVHAQLRKNSPITPTAKPLTATIANPRALLASALAPTPAPTALPTKGRSKSVKPTKPAKPKRYSEDLSDLLQQR